MPVSQLTTAPTITEAPDKSYGEIVNKDFYDELSSARESTTRPPPSKNARRVSDNPLEEENREFPLGNPHYNYYYSQNNHPANSRVGTESYYQVMLGLVLRLKLNSPYVTNVNIRSMFFTLNQSRAM